MTQKNNSNIVAIITMCFIFAMISFVTNMGAPFGNIWGVKYEWAKMMGNMMNFAAYLFMGIPAGKMLTKVGYKKTALIALIVGIAGLLVQYASSIFGDDIEVMSYDGKPVALNLFIYLLGASFAASAFACSTRSSTRCSTSWAAAATAATSSYRLAAR